MFQLTIATPFTTIFQGEVLSLTLPGKDGSMQILTNHADLITALHSGPLKLITKENKQFMLQITGNGFFQMKKKQAVLLAESISENIA